MRALPPGPAGPVALTRWLYGMLRHPYATLRELQHTYGAVSSIRVGGSRYVMMFGSDANRFLFANTELFRWREAFDALVPIDGETALIVSDGDDHRRRRRLVQPAFGRRQLGSYLPTMSAATDAALEAWAPGSQIEIYREMRKVIRRSTTEVLFGSHLAMDAAFLGERLQPLLNVVNQPPLVQQLSRRLRTPLWRRASASRAVVDDRIYAEIAAQRASARDDQTLLARLITSSDPDSGYLSDIEIRDQVVSLIVAGYETTSAAMAWAIYALLAHENAWERARDEILTLPDDIPTLDDLENASYLGHVLDETLRLFPPAVIGARKVVEDFEFDNHRIPAGSMVIYSPYVTHRMPDVWPNPDRFEPDRWTNAEVNPAEYLPFGGGAHRCIGARFATLELKTMLIRLLRRTSLRLGTSAVPRATSLVAMRPREGLPVLVDRRD